MAEEEKDEVPKAVDGDEFLESLDRLSENIERANELMEKVAPLVDILPKLGNTIAQHRDVMQALLEVAANHQSPSMAELIAGIAKTMIENKPRGRGK